LSTRTRTAGFRSRTSGDLMGWSIPTYDGIAAHGRPSNLRLAMFELIRAIDERTLALAQQSQFGWWVAASSSSSQLAPTFDDLEFLKCTGNKTGGTTANANKAYRNMVLITDRIIDMLDAGRFVTASGGSTKYTQASMESAIGTTLEYPVSVTEARWWQSVQDALDLMIYAWSELTPMFGESGIGQSFPYSTTDAAWSNRATPVGIPNASVSALSAGWQVRSTGGGTYVSVIGSGSSREFHLSSLWDTELLGVVEYAEYEYTSRWDDYTGSDFEIAIDSDSINVTGAASSTAACTPMAIGTVITKTSTVTTSEPSTNPFDPSGSNDIGFVGIAITGLNVQHDLSTILTDQA